MILVLTCEHAFPDIPEEYEHLFSATQEILSTHEAYDPGAFDLFKTLQPIADHSKMQPVGRLLVESNRSLRNRKLFSRFSSVLDKKEKEYILDSYYHPYRQNITEQIRKYIDSGKTVLHLSVHSFTPVLNGVKRNCDLGLLYDPERGAEKHFSKELKARIKVNYPDLNVRFNYPYLGKADGLTTSLRKTFKKNYLGIELEVNQAWVQDNIMEPGIKSVILTSLKELLKKVKPR